MMQTEMNVVQKCVITMTGDFETFFFSRKWAFLSENEDIY